MSSVCLSRTSSSTIGIASAISTAATTKTRKTRTAPTGDAVCCAKVTRLRLTPFSISSMHISITSTLRRTMTPTRPSENRATATPTRSWVLSMARDPADADQGERGDDGGDEQHRGELEEQPVLAEERDREARDAVRGLAERADRGRQRLPDARRQHAEQDDEAGDARNDEARVARPARLAHLEQHDHVDHEQHHRADVDQHLEGGDEVHAENAVDGAEEDHGRDQRHRDAHRLAQHEHEGGARERAARAQDEQQRVDAAEQRVDHRGPPVGSSAAATGLGGYGLSLIHISEPTRRTPISY